MNSNSARLTKACIHLSRLTHNLELLQQEAGGVPLWPVVKANAYGHGATIIARHLMGLGYNTLGVADVGEALALTQAGIQGRYIVLSATLPEHSEALVAIDCQPVVCTLEMVEALAREAGKAGKRLSAHLMVDTGMGRIGVPPDAVLPFLDNCSKYPAVRICGLMSHFPRADESDKRFSLEQIEVFRRLMQTTRAKGIQVHHMANSAAILDLPNSRFDAVRPGIAIYGLRPSRHMANSRVDELQAVLEWKSRITFLKEVPAGTGLSYGHAFIARQASLIATIPVGYGDGLSRNLSNNLDMLVQGQRCPQVGRITMDMSLIDVSALRGQVQTGDEVVLIGRQGVEQITADEYAEKLGTINYETVTNIAQRVHRVAVHGSEL